MEERKEGDGLQGKIFGMISLGCDKNRVDGERLLAEVRRRGCAVSDDLSEVNVLIVNTCAFLEAARKEAIDTVLECDAYRSGKLEKIVVSGCLPEKFEGDLVKYLTEADVLLGIGDASALFAALEEAYRGVRADYVRRAKLPPPRERVLTTPPHYAYLKISDGCSNHCTYCLIPKIRGPFRSYPMEDLVAEAASLGELAELILVAQDTTRYGEDLYGENKLPELIKKLSQLDNICHIRLLYCYPERITDALIAEVRENPKVLKYLDIPLQHAEDAVLKRMGRKGTRASLAALLEKLRREIPEIAVRTTFISGFPGETEEEHRALQEFLREQTFFNCGFFAYSREEETPAYRLPGQIRAQTKARRVRELYAVQEEVSRRNLARYAGRTLDVLCDGIDYEKLCFVGRTWFQAPEIDGVTYFQAAHAETGKRYRVKIDRTDAYDLYGTAEESL